MFADYRRSVSDCEISNLASHFFFHVLPTELIHCVISMCTRFLWRYLGTFRKQLDLLCHQLWVIIKTYWSVSSTLTADVRKLLRPSYQCTHLWERRVSVRASNFWILLHEVLWARVLLRSFENSNLLVLFALVNKYWLSKNWAIRIGGKRFKNRAGWC